MANLTAKQESFVRLMGENADLERRGVELLLKHPHFEDFFDALRTAGLFAAEKNPPLLESGEPGFYRAAYWPVLDYMLGLAKLCGERRDHALSEKLLAIIRTVSTWKDAENHPRDNYITNAKFAEILGLLPPEAITGQDLSLIPIWLGVKAGKLPVSTALERHLLPHLVSAGSPDDLNKAVSVLRSCFEIKWVDAKELGERERVPLMALDNFSAKQIVTKYARTLGLAAGELVAAVFADSVRDVFSAGTRKDFSYLHVPAVEDHAQNHMWREVESCVVVGLRESLLGWCDAERTSAPNFISALLDDEVVMLHRIAIYVIGQRWKLLNGLYPKLCSLAFFNSGHLHELYHLLQDHFAELSDGEKERTLDVIRSTPRPDWGKDPDVSLRWSQLRWLSSIENKGHSRADQWAQELRSGNPPIGLSEHPDFNSYMQTRTGPGPSPYSSSELAGFADAGILVDKLNSFSIQDVWNGPSMEGLASSLEAAVQSSPEPFLKSLNEFLKAKRRYQYSLITSLQRAWDTGTEQNSFDWSDAWDTMLVFFEGLVHDQDFWNEEDNGENHRDWVVSSIADCLRSGTTNDLHAFPTALLPRALAIIGILLDRAEGTAEPGDDPMFRALNTPKGRAIEALFSHSLRTCRVGDQEHGTHTDQWGTARPLFEAELKKCRNSNFEFSTLCAAYLSQLEYMGGEWIEQNIPRVFPADFPSNTLSAISGLGHATFSHSIHRLLLSSGILDRALAVEVPNRAIRENLLARVASAYLWGDEDLSSPRFEVIFKNGSEADLQFMTSCFWSVRGPSITEDQRERVRAFWSKCIAWADEIQAPPKDVLSALSRLASFLQTADGEDQKLLESVAPYVYIHHNVYEFIDELIRLVEASPDGVSSVLRKMTEARIPDFDYQDQIRNLLELLVAKGKREDVLFHAERMRTLPGMQELFDRVTRTN